VRRALISFFLIGGLVLAGCSSGAATKGVLTGRAWRCLSSGAVTVEVFGSLYPGQWTAALQRVSTFGADSGEPLVASQRMPSGGTYRFPLPAGRYVVDGAVPARLITVVGGEVTMVTNRQGEGCI
jgi:hypothetical protein